METTATHDTEYVDIVVGYQHILLLGLLFGVLMFSTGYFIGSYRTQSDRADRAASTAMSPASGPRAAQLPAVQVPPTGIERPASEVGEIAENVARLSPGALAPVANGNASPTATSAAPQEAAHAARPLTTRAALPETTTAPLLNPQSAKAAATSAVPMPANPNPGGTAAAATENYFWDDLYQRYRNPQTQDSFKIYLRMSFRAQQEAETLIHDLAAEGFPAVIEGQSVEGRQMVLIGPFADYQSATSLAKVLKQRNLEAFPIRR